MAVQFRCVSFVRRLEQTLAGLLLLTPGIYNISLTWFKCGIHKTKSKQYQVCEFGFHSPGTVLMSRDSSLMIVLWRRMTLDDLMRHLSTKLFVGAYESHARHLRELAPHHRRPPDRLDFDSVAISIGLAARESLRQPAPGRVPWCWLTEALWAPLFQKHVR